MMRTFQRILLFLGMTILCGMVFCGCSKEENQIKGQTAGIGSGNKENNMSFKAPKMDTAFLLQKAKNGTFTGQSRPDEDGEYAKLLLTIQDHRITAARFEGYLKNGTLKDKDYGKTNGKIENKVVVCDSVSVGQLTSVDFGKLFAHFDVFRKIGSISLLRKLTPSAFNILFGNAETCRVLHELMKSEPG